MAKNLGLAREAALLAWEKAIKPYYRKQFSIHEKEMEGPATDADLAADSLILEYLRSHCPQGKYGYLSEESDNSTERFAHDMVWIIDPIDGTSDFIRGEEDFAVQIGLAARLEDQGRYYPVLGVVYQPTRSRLYLGALRLGAFEENLETGERVPLEVSQIDSLGPSRMVITKSNLGEKTKAIVAQLSPGTVYQMGSLGLKMCEVARGSADYYINPSPRNCKEWDVCAPDAILREAGGAVTDLHGRDISYNNEDHVLRNGLVTSNQIIHPDILETMEEFKNRTMPLTR
ncbi:MAG: 3'(2'),5'-bisphosphate nucleotidase CysQ [Candidatus Sumerlaeia bacterium]|nr:3'(2'),5'-bisphosphate nucleotidase CysQ [Candidatus Sumerlaeia bacterium]